MNETLELNRLTHEYTYGQVKLRSVTKVLSAVLRTESPWWDTEHKLRGTFVHRITDAIDAKDWDPRLVEFPASLGWDEQRKEKIIQRGFAYQRFVEENGFHVLKNELMIHSEGLRLAGTLDKLGILTRGQYAGDLAIVDVKSGKPTPAAILQVMLYQILLEEDEGLKYSFKTPKVKQRIILHLKDNGKPDPVYRNENNGHMDQYDAMAALRTYDFMERNHLV